MKNGSLCFVLVLDFAGDFEDEDEDENEAEGALLKKICQFETTRA